MKMQKKQVVILQALSFQGQVFIDEFVSRFKELPDTYTIFIIEKDTYFKVSIPQNLENQGKLRQSVDKVEGKLLSIK